MGTSPRRRGHRRGHRDRSVRPRCPRRRPRPRRAVVDGGGGGEIRRCLRHGTRGFGLSALILATPGPRSSASYTPGPWPAHLLRRTGAPHGRGRRAGDNPDPAGEAGPEAGEAGREEGAAAPATGRAGRAAPARAGPALPVVVRAVVRGDADRAGPSEVVAGAPARRDRPGRAEADRAGAGAAARARRTAVDGNPET